MSSAGFLRPSTIFRIGLLARCATSLTGTRHGAGLAEGADDDADDAIDDIRRLLAEPAQKLRRKGGLR